MTTTVARVQVTTAGAIPVGYVALIGDTETLVRYESVIDRSQFFDVLRVPHGGEPEWIGEWHLMWSDRTRGRLVDDVRALRPH